MRRTLGRRTFGRRSLGQRLASLGLAALIGLGQAPIALAQVATPAVATKRPNIVVILVDDAALMDFGAFGGEARTPNIDRLARSGAMFTSYRTSPLCSPSRSMLLTGVDNQGDTYVNNKRPAGLGRNMGQGPNYATFDLRLSRRFRYSTKESRAVELLAEGFNLLNRTNFRTVNNVVGDVPYSTLGSPIVGNRGPASNPLAFTSALDARQFQIGLKLFW